MTTIELELCKSELAREILNTDSAEMLEVMKKVVLHFAKRAQSKPTESEALTPYTMEELDTRIAEAEADFEAGHDIPSKEMRHHMKAFIASL